MCAKLCFLFWKSWKSSGVCGNVNNVLQHLSKKTLELVKWKLAVLFMKMIPFKITILSKISDFVWKQLELVSASINRYDSFEVIVTPVLRKKLSFSFLGPARSLKTSELGLAILAWKMFSGKTKKKKRFENVNVLLYLSLKHKQLKHVVSEGNSNVWKIILNKITKSFYSFTSLPLKDFKFRKFLVNPQL